MGRTSNRGERPASNTAMPTFHARHHSLRYGVMPVLALSLLVFLVWQPTGVKVYAAAESKLAQSGPQGKLAVVGAQNAVLYDAPGGTEGQTLLPGSTLTAVGRTADNLWVVVSTEEGVAGWVATDQLVIFGLSDLPVMAENPVTTGETPQSEPTPRAAPQMTATVQSTTPTVAPPTATKPPTPTAAPPTATPTATASPTPLPPTPTPLPTSTPTASPTPPIVSAIRSEVIAVVGAGGAVLVNEPEGDAVRDLSTGTALTVHGRSADSLWLAIRTSDNTTGWIEANNVVVFNIGSLPVIGADAMVTTSVAATGTVTTTNTLAATVITSTGALTESASITEEESMVAATETPSAAAQTVRPTPVADGRPVASVISDGRLNVRSGPSIEYRVLVKALPGDTFVALARNGPATWVQVELAEATSGFGWVSADLVATSIPVVDLPISTEVGSPPVPQPTPTTAAPVTATVPATPVTVPATTQVANRAIVQNTGPTGLSGNLVIQSSWGGTFYLYNLASGALRPLGGGYDPEISPDGGQVAFTREGGETGIYLMNLDGSNERQIFGERLELRAPKWSPDGSKLVFSRSDGTYNCRALGFGNLCPSERELLSNLPEFPANTPEEVIEDIEQSILSQFDKETRSEWALARIGVDGKDYRDIPSLDSARMPDWGEGGIVYQSAGGIQRTEDSMEPNNQRVIFQQNYHDPDWQPGGGRIIFQSKEGSHWEIFGVNSDGSGLASLTRPVTTLVDHLPSNVSPAWSPDGQHIVYLSNRDPNNEAGTWRVWVMNADGSNQRPLPIEIPIEYNYVGEQMVSWGK